ncbi:MAG: AAA family ATPase [Vulcanibacillus sp.]
MSVKKIKVEGFKSIKSLELDLTDLNVLIGANGAGKSNFINIFEFMRKIVESELQTYIAQKGSLNNIFYKGIKKTSKIYINFSADRNGYEIELLPTEENKLIFSKEICSYETDYGKDYHEDYGKGHFETNAIGISESRVVRYTFAKILKEMNVYHFHDTSNTSPIKQKHNIDDNRGLKSDGSNIAPYLYLLKENFPNDYDKIFKTIKSIAPFIQEFRLEPDNINKSFIQLEWKETNSDYYFNANSFSDGTLRFICLATLLIKPDIGDIKRTIIIDEPELGLHPNALGLLGSLIKSVSKINQIIISTQSVTLLNQFSYEDIIVVEHDKENGTLLKRLEKEEVEKWIEDYSIGDLWEKNIISGRP